MSDPFIAHSEISNEIYIIDGKKKYPVTEQVVSAMKATGRLNERPQGKWEKVIDIYQNRPVLKCSICGRTVRDAHRMDLDLYPYCHCGAKMEAENE